MLERRGPPGKFKTTRRIIRDPLRCIPEWAEKYGDPFWFETVNGMTFASGREAVVKEILRLSEDDLQAYGASVVRPLVGENSLLQTDGVRHQRDRKLLMPPFHGERMRAYNDTLKSLAEKAVACEVGELLDVGKAANFLALSAIVELVFGLEPGKHSDEMMDAIGEMSEHSNPAFLFIQALQKAPFGLGPWGTFTKARDRVMTLLQRAIDSKRRQAPGTDILSMMLAARYDDGTKMSDDELLDQLRTLLLAGHETSTTASVWAVYLAHKNLAVCARLAETTAGLSDDSAEWAKSPYIGALFDETLRYRPILDSFVRQAKRDLTLAGHLVNKGDSILGSIAMAHFSEDNFDEPQVFRPERFLENTYSYAQYMPFGGGIRRCIGSAFAKSQTCIFVAALMKQGRYELIDKEVKSVRRGLTLTQDRPVRIRRMR